MVDTLLKIIDRLISLRAIQTDRRKEIFARVLEPVVSDLHLVHGNYLAIFEEAEREIDNAMQKHVKPREALQVSLNFLKEKRVQYEPVRTNLKAFLHELREMDLQTEERELLYALIWYFPKGELSARSTAASKIFTSLDVMLDEHSDERKYLDDASKVRWLRHELGNTVLDLKDAWSDVCTKFAKLKVTIVGL